MEQTDANTHVITKKLCSSCVRNLNLNDFVRNNKENKTCNKCGAKKRRHDLKKRGPASASISPSNLSTPSGTTNSPEQAHVASAGDISDAAARPAQPGASHLKRKRSLESAARSDPISQRHCMSTQSCGNANADTAGPAYTISPDVEYVDIEPPLTMPGPVGWRASHNEACDWASDTVDKWSLEGSDHGGRECHVAATLGRSDLEAERSLEIGYEDEPGSSYGIPDNNASGSLLNEFNIGNDLACPGTGNMETKVMAESAESGPLYGPTIMTLLSSAHNGFAGGTSAGDRFPAGEASELVYVNVGGPIGTVSNAYDATTIADKTTTHVLGSPTNASSSRSSSTGLPARYAWSNPSASSRSDETPLALVDDRTDQPAAASAGNSKGHTESVIATSSELPHSTLPVSDSATDVQSIAVEPSFRITDALDTLAIRTSRMSLYSWLAPSSRRTMASSNRSIISRRSADMAGPMATETDVELHAARGGTMTELRQRMSKLGPLLNTKRKLRNEMFACVVNGRPSRLQDILATGQCNVNDTLSKALQSKVTDALTVLDVAIVLGRLEIVETLLTWGSFTKTALEHAGGFLEVRMLNSIRVGDSKYLETLFTMRSETMGDIPGDPLTLVMLATESPSADVSKVLRRHLWPRPYATQASYDLFVTRLEALYNQDYPPRLQALMILSAAVKWTYRAWAPITEVLRRKISFQGDGGVDAVLSDEFSNGSSRHEVSLALTENLLTQMQLEDSAAITYILAVSDTAVWHDKSPADRALCRLIEAAELLIATSLKRHSTLRHSAVSAWQSMSTDMRLNVRKKYHGAWRRFGLDFAFNHINKANEWQDQFVFVVEMAIGSADADLVQSIPDYIEHGATVSGRLQEIFFKQLADFVNHGHLDSVGTLLELGATLQDRGLFENSRYDEDERAALRAFLLGTIETAAVHMQIYFRALMKLGRILPVNTFGELDILNAIFLDESTQALDEWLRTDKNCIGALSLSVQSAVRMNASRQVLDKLLLLSASAVYGCTVTDLMGPTRPGHRVVLLVDGRPLTLARCFAVQHRRGKRYLRLSSADLVEILADKSRRSGHTDMSRAMTAIKPRMWEPYSYIGMSAATILDLDMREQLLPDRLDDKVKHLLRWQLLRWEWFDSGYFEHVPSAEWISPLITDRVDLEHQVFAHKQRGGSSRMPRRSPPPHETQHDLKASLSAKALRVKGQQLHGAPQRPRSGSSGIRLSPRLSELGCATQPYEETDLIARASDSVQSQCLRRPWDENILE
ncbi:hypothetical protein LTR95_002067 [Oleoguttula sp. CCFEE 5521]